MSFELWRWRAGTLGADDVVLAAALGRDGSVVLAGYTEGDWGPAASGSKDFAAVKLDAQGDELWRWQENATRETRVTSAMMIEDGSVVIGGTSTGSWAEEMSPYESAMAAAKIASNGTVLWRFQMNLAEDSYAFAGVLGPNDSVVLAGYVRGGDGRNWFDKDFAAIKLDRDGNLVWSWQEGTDDEDQFNAAAMGVDGSVVLAGFTRGSWSMQAETTWRAYLAAAKLDADGVLLWKWQDEYLSSWEKREFCAVVRADNDSAVLVVDDFFIVKLDAAGIVLWELNLSDYQRTAEAAALVDDGAIVIVGSQDANTFAVKIGANGNAVEWTWEEETFGEENAFHAVATGPEGRAVLAGASRPLVAPRAWQEDFWAVLVNLSASPPTPHPSSDGIYPVHSSPEGSIVSSISSAVFTPRWGIVAVLVSLIVGLETLIIFSKYQRR